MMAKPDTLAVLGGGKIGEALLSGLLRGERSAADIVVSERYPARADYLARTFGIKALAVADAVEQADEVSGQIELPPVPPGLGQCGPGVMVVVPRPAHRGRRQGTDVAAAVP